LGSAKIYNAILLDNEKHLSFDSLEIISSVIDSNKILTLETNELDASLKGNFKILELPQVFQLFLNKYYPAYIAKPTQTVENQNFSFYLKTRNVSDYISLVNHNLSGLDNSVVSGRIILNDNIFSVDAEIPDFGYKSIEFKNIHFTGLGSRDTLGFSGDIDDVIINDSLRAPSTHLQILAHNDNSDIRVITSANKTLNSADLSVNIKTNKNGFRLEFKPSSFTINNKKWDIEEGGILQLDKQLLTADGIRFDHGGQGLSISSIPSSIGASNDLIIAISKLDFGDFAPLFIKDPALQGLLSGQVRINDPFGRPVVDFSGRIDQLFLNTDSVGVFSFNGEYALQSGRLTSQFDARNQAYNFSGDFAYNPADTSTSQLSGHVHLQQSQIAFLNTYLQDIFSGVTGQATGDLVLSGTTSNTKLTGSVVLNNTALTVDYTQCRYRLLNDTRIDFNPDEIDLGALTIEDTLGNTATVSGKIYHNFFDNFFFNDVHFRTNPRGNFPAKFLLLNTTARDNSEFYGKVIGSAEMSLDGFSNDMKMTISGEPTDSSLIYLPTNETAETGSLDYIEFAKFGHEMRADLSRKQNANIKVDMSLTANPYAKIYVILDEVTGDIIRAQGSGKLNITSGTIDPTTIRGRYDIEQGSYTFNFQTISKTPFTLQKGYIEWQGDPYLANLNIDAIYTAQGVDLSSIPTSAGPTNTTGDVDIIFKLGGTLRDPRPEFEFQFPFGNPLKTDPIANEYLKNFQSDQNELNRQVTSLLLFNSFMTNQQNLLSGTSTGSLVARSVGQILSATLSSSLNTWVQQLFKTHSVNLYTNVNTTDFNFIKGNTPKEIQNVGAFGFRTSFLKNRLLVKFGGNVDYRLAQTTTNSNANFLFSPDVSFEYLISPDGRFRVIGFNRSDADLGDISGITRRNRTGIQLSYSKEADSIGAFFINDKKRKHRKVPPKKK
ncbi:MAG: translocation/assembly module TamB domain-containing protein, partial [Bacteroidota bacterium]|nr:translocation/assembly module TamB domain-containing protein [Bacteroidota bacterium]